MGALDLRLYLDASAIIPLFESEDDLSIRLRSLFTHYAAQPENTICSSELSLTECIVHPAREGNADLLDRYEHFFGGDDLIDVLPIDWSIFHAAGLLRGRHKALRAPDAIHVAAALRHKCSLLLTGDKRLCGRYRWAHPWSSTLRPTAIDTNPVDVISFHDTDQSPFNALLDKAYHR